MTLNSTVYQTSVFFTVVSVISREEKKSRMEINKSRPTVPIGFSENVIESAAYLVAALSKLGFNLDWIQTRRDLYVRIQ